MYCLNMNRMFRLRLLVSLNFVKLADLFCLFADFSFLKWMDENELTQDNLNDNDVSKLFSYLGLSYYLNSVSCNGSRSPYYPSQHGWNKSKFFLVYCHFRKIKHSLYMNTT